MDWLVFGLAVAVIATIGIGIGLFVAPGLTRWSDRATDRGGEADQGGDSGPGAHVGPRNGDHDDNDDGSDGDGGDGGG